MCRAEPILAAVPTGSPVMMLIEDITKTKGKLTRGVGRLAGLIAGFLGVELLPLGLHAALCFKNITSWVGQHQAPRLLEVFA